MIFKFFISLALKFDTPFSTSYFTKQKLVKQQLNEDLLNLTT